MIYLPIDFPTYNESINSNRGSKHWGASLKKKYTNEVVKVLRFEPKVRKIPIGVEFIWLMKTRGRDLDGTAFARKVVLDGMVKAGMIPNDNLNNVVSLKDDFILDKKKVGVYLKIDENPKRLSIS